MNPRITEPGDGAVRPRLHPILVQVYRWRWWTGLAILLAVGAAVALSGHLWFVVTLACGAVALVFWFVYMARWGRAVERAGKAFRDELNGE